MTLELLNDLSNYLKDQKVGKPLRLNCVEPIHVHEFYVDDEEEEYNSRLIE